MENLEEKIKKEKILYKGSFLELKNDEVVLPNGKVATREYLHHPGAVAILAMDKEDNIYIERQYRHPLREVIYEIPAGKLEKDENIFKAALRELEEETGLIAKNLYELGALYPCVGYSDEVIYVYYANDFENSHQHLDEEEFLDVIKLPLKRVKEMILNGEIKDSKTIYALYLYEMKLSK